MTIESNIDAAVWLGEPFMGVGIVAVIEGHPPRRVHISERFGLLPESKSADCNEAEYVALLSLLNYALRMGCRRLKAYSDSEVVVRHIRKEYVCGSRFEELYRACCRRIQRFEYFKIVHVRREKNSEANALAQKALQGNSKKIDPLRLLVRPDISVLSGLFVEFEMEAHDKFH